jgi:hypothetical protein
LESDLFKIIETLIFNAMNLSKKYGTGAAKIDTSIEQLSYENLDQYF